MGLLLLISLCGGLSALFASSNRATGLSTTPTVQGADRLALITWTPLPTRTLTPTNTPGPTRTPAPTFDLSTATIVILPSTTVRPGVGASNLVIITYVNVEEEYVDIQNIGGPVNLQGWLLVSERGDERCALRGTLQPNEVLRIWTGTHPTGLSCGFNRNIWSNNDPDPAVLYNPRGQEVSRYP